MLFWRRLERKSDVSLSAAVNPGYVYFVFRWA
jgi:hypothetical protein